MQLALLWSSFIHWKEYFHLHPKNLLLLAQDKWWKSWYPEKYSIVVSCFSGDGLFLHSKVAACVTRSSVLCWLARWCWCGSRCRRSTPADRVLGCQSSPDGADDTEKSVSHRHILIDQWNWSLSWRSACTIHQQYNLFASRKRETEGFFAIYLHEKMRTWSGISSSESTIIAVFLPHSATQSVILRISSRYTVCSLSWTLTPIRNHFCLLSSGFHTALLLT